MAKRKLLITLGDSYTEGVGCYDFSLNPEQLEYSNISMDFYNQQRSIFHEKGWPNRVGKKLGYDKVINLGYGGSSNSTHLKLFIDKILPLFPKLKEEYDILVIWMMTASSRFSFYSDTGIKDFMPSIFGHSPVKDNSLHLEKGYLVDMPEVIIGPLREQIH